MKNCLIIFAFIAASSAVGFAAVLQFEPMKLEEKLKSEMSDVMDIILKPRMPSRYIPDNVYQHMGLNPSKRLLSYNWKNCGNKSIENFIVNDITLSPDPLSFPGNLVVAFNLTLKVTADTPIKAVVVLEKKVGSAWIEIPCIGNIGSCTYDDICPFLKDVQCPPEFVDAKIPCKCPFPKGNFVLKKASFQVDASFLPTGDYHLRATGSYKNVFGGCYDIYRPDSMKQLWMDFVDIGSKIM